MRIWQLHLHAPEHDSRETPAGPRGDQLEAGPTARRPTRQSAA